MSEKYMYINKELKRIPDSSSASWLSEKYLEDIETNLSKFHRGMEIFQVVDYQVCNGGFLQLFDNEYMDVLEDTVYFFEDELKKHLVLGDCLDKVILLFQEAIEINTEYMEELELLDTCDEWYDEKAELLLKSYSYNLSEIDTQYYEIEKILWGSLDLFAQHNFANNPCKNKT